MDKIISHHLAHGHTQSGGCQNQSHPHQQEFESMECLRQMSDTHCKSWWSGKHTYIKQYISNKNCEASSHVKQDEAK